MRNRARGASQVSLVWLIVVIFIALGAIGTAWIQGQNSANFETDAATQRSAAIQANEALSTTNTSFQNFSQKIGFLGGSTVGQPGAADAAIATAKQALGAEAPSDAKSVEDLLNAALRVAASRKQAVESRDQQIAQLTSSLDAANRSVSTVRSELQRQLDDANTAARDQAANDAARVQNLESQLTQQRTAARDAAEQLSAARDDAAKQIASIQKEFDLVRAKNADLSTKLAFLRVPDQPKGRVIDSSEALPVAWVDVGRKDRVLPGMRFEVVQYDASRQLRAKGWAEVVKVEDAMSEVRLELADPLRPVTRGDLLRNPLFDPKGERRAALVGRFPLSAGGKQGVASRLGDLGITVVEAVDPSTDYVIVGAPEISNNGIIQDIESAPEILAAAKFGTLRYALRDLEGYFKR